MIPEPAPDPSSGLPPAHPLEPEDFPFTSEGEADNKQEQAPPQTLQAPKKKGKQHKEPPKPMCKSQHIPKLSNYMKQLDTGEGTTREDLNTVFSAEIINFMAAAIQEANSNPQNITEAQKRLDWPKWKEAMDCELATLEKAGTWETVLHPPNTNIVRSKWVFCIKRKADGTIEKYKAQLCYVMVETFTRHELKSTMVFTAIGKSCVLS